MHNQKIYKAASINHVQVVTKFLMVKSGLTEKLKYLHNISRQLECLESLFSTKRMEHQFHNLLTEPSMNLELKNKLDSRKTIVRFLEGPFPMSQN